MGKRKAMAKRSCPTGQSSKEPGMERSFSEAKFIITTDSSTKDNFKMGFLMGLGLKLGLIDANTRVSGSEESL